MANELKRDLIKYCRDKAKSGYEKGSVCEICNSSELLEFHHFSSMTYMLEKWMKLGKRTAETADEIMEIRDAFIEEHHTQIYDETVTLCKEHHAKLHKVYGQKPILATAKKQTRWVQRQKDKYAKSI